MNTCLVGGSRFAPVMLPPMRAGEIDGRYIDFTADLGPVGDQIVSINDVTIDILRRDGFPMTASDLALAGPDWPNTLDATHLVVTIGLTAPTAASYKLTLTVNKTMQGRLFIRDLTLDVLAAMG